VSIAQPFASDRITWTSGEGEDTDDQGDDDVVRRALALRMLERLARLEPGDPRRAALRDEVIAQYMPYARYLASRYGIRGHHAADVLQVAYVGLVKAVDRFDPDYGTTFLTYATPTIAGELKRYFRDSTCAVHVPRRIQELSTQLRPATEILVQQLNRSPTVRELAGSLGAPPQDVVDALEAAGLRHVASLDAPVDTDNGRGAFLGELLGAHDPAVQNVVDRETLRPLLAELSARERKILSMRFFREMTQTQMGRELGVSQMQVSRLLSAILGRLRQRANAESAA
jgi:RNA polymerase sigma-B factor